MLAFIGVHNFSPRTAAETVRTFSRPAVVEVQPEPAPVAVVAPEIANAFGLTKNPAVIVSEPAAAPSKSAKYSKPAPRPSLSTSATVDRRRFLSDVRQAEKHCGRSSVAVAVLTIEPGRVSLDSTDGEFLLSQTVSFSYVDGPSAAVAVPVKKLSTLLSKLTAGDISICLEVNAAQDSATVSIMADGGEFDIPAEPADGNTDTAAKNSARFEFFRSDFPATFATSTTAGELRDAFERCQIATDSETTRYALGGIRIEPAPDSLILAATDSRRLAVRNVRAETAGEFPTVFVGTVRSEMEPAGLGYVLPISAVARIVDGLKRVPDGSPVAVAAHYAEPVDVPISVDSKGKPNAWRVTRDAVSVVVECSDVDGTRFSVRSRVLEGRFPRYRDVIPKTFNLTISANRKALETALKTAAAVCSDESRLIDFILTDENGSGELRGESTENGRSRVRFAWRIESGSVDSATTEEQRRNGSPFSASFDPKYILEYFKQSTAERVVFGIVDGDTAAVITDENQAAAGCYVVMPCTRNG